MNQEIKPPPIEEKKCPKCGWRLDGQHLNPHCTACFAYAASFCYPEMKAQPKGGES